jgi:mycothiol synthase
MTTPPLIIREYRASDLDWLLEIESAAGARDRPGCVSSSSDLMESARRRNHDSVAIIVAERSGEIVGYASVMPEARIRRAVLRWQVHTDRHPRGVAGRLVDNAISRTLSLGAGAIHANIWQSSPAAGKLLRRRGFRRVRRYLELRLDLSNTRVTEMKKDPFRSGFLTPSWEEKLTDLQNRSFAGTWGYNPNTVDEMVLRTRLPGSSLKDVIIGFGFEKQPIGYCWTKTHRSKDEGPNQEIGRIHMLGVDPDCRGRGVGRHLLVAGISELARKGVRIIELTVDQENRAACALYRSVGFKNWRSSLWYEKKIG